MKVKGLSRTPAHKSSHWFLLQLLLLIGSKLENVLPNWYSYLLVKSCLFLWSTEGYFLTGNTETYTSVWTVCIFSPQTYLFLIEGKLLHIFVLASAMYQHELVTGTPVSPLYLTSFPPPTLSHPSRLSVSICFKGTLVTNPVGTWQSVSHLWGMKAPEKCLERTEFKQPSPRKCVNHQYLFFPLWASCKYIVLNCLQITLLPVARVILGWASLSKFLVSFWNEMQG